MCTIESVVTIIEIFKLPIFFSVKEDTLSDMVDAMQENVGLVHQMPYTCDSVGLPSTLEKVLFLFLLLIHGRQDYKRKANTLELTALFMLL